MNSLDSPVSQCPDHGEYSLHTGCLACGGTDALQVKRTVTRHLPLLQPGTDIRYHAAKPRLIALSSPAMGSGKSVVANHLVEAHGFRLVKFAGPLKNMVRTLLRDAGIPVGDVERMVEGDLKEAVIPQLGVTPRRLMQTIGGEWGRDCIATDFWVHLTKAAIRTCLAAGTSVVVDDMRYPNEMQMILSLGGHCIRIVRPGVAVTEAHQSEGQLDGIQMLRITNDGTLDDLRRHANTLATCPLN